MSSMDTIRRRPAKPAGVRPGARREQPVPSEPIPEPPIQMQPELAPGIQAEAPKVTESKGLKKWAPLVIMSLALAIIIIDTTVLNVSLATIIRELNTNIQSLQWVISAYALTLAALTVTGGRLGDLFGRKRMFMVGAVIFAIGSFVASISHSVGLLLAGESIIEGIGAALMMPATASLIVSSYHDRDRAIAFGVWGGIAAAASAIGPIVGGFLTSHYSWRWAFRINIVVVVILLLGSILINESRDRDEAPTLDWFGVLLSATGLLAIVYGIIESAIFGWWRAKEPFAIFGHAFHPWDLSVVPIALAAGFILLSLFVAWQRRLERRGRTPLVSMKLFRNRQFTAGAITTGVLTLSLMGLIFSLPVFLQSVRSLDALHTGFALLPMSLTILFVAPLSAVLSQKIAPKRLIQLGLAIDAAGALVLAASLSINSTTWTLTPGLMLFGIGMGLVIAQISNITLSAVPINQSGEASGVQNTLRQVGASFGSAIVGAVLLATLTANLSSGVKASTVIPERMKDQLSQVVTHQTSNVEFGGAKLNGNIPSAVREEIIKISHEATAAAIRRALLYTGAFAVLALLVAFGLPNVKKLDLEQSASGH